ncbi:MAG: ubiquinone biosynthesis protein [Chitinophagales bacterium]|jgi:ubiquinone biosynthesis protein
MPSNSKIYKPSYRKRKAYFTAIQVFLSYYYLSFKAKFFGENYYKKHLPQVHLKNADRINFRIQELQGLFIKFGQLISNLSNVLPLAFREPLESLQDRIQAKDFDEVKQTIQSELGQAFDKVFTDFNPEPIAAASIGQVHKAKLDGKDVVVKVQHANIETIAEADLEIIKNLVKLHAFFMDIQGLEHTYEQVKLMIQEELDYQLEAKSMQEISVSLQASPELRVKVPEVYPAYNTKKILVAEFCPGVKVSNTKKLLRWDVNLEDVAKRIIEMYCKMVLIDGFYHADPHPGNILVDETGQIILLDFGATARLSENTKEAIPELIEAIVKNDTEETVVALRKLGFLGSDKDSRRFVEKLINVFKEFVENEVEFDGLNFQNIQLNSGIGSFTSLLMEIDLRDVSNNIKIPKEYILLNRTVVLLLGNTFNLAPELNALTVVRPFVKKHLMQHNDDFISVITRAIKNQVATAVSLPKDLSSFLKKSRPEEIEDELKAINMMLRKFYKLAKSSILTILISFGIYVLMQFQLNIALNITIGVVLAVLLFNLAKTLLKSSK